MNALALFLWGQGSLICRIGSMETSSQHDLSVFHLVCFELLTAGLDRMGATLQNSFL